MIKNQFYLPSPPPLDKETLEVFEEYSGLAPDEVVPHIIKVREKAWNSSPFPCLGLFSFLTFTISSHPEYRSRILPLLKKKAAVDEPVPTLLDLGCGLAQDLRKLVYDGVSPDRLYASDLNPDFLNYGFELFCDDDKLDKDHFAVADIFDESPTSKLIAWERKFDIILISSFFHLFDHDKQKDMARRIIRLLKDEAHGTMIVGHQIGAEVPGWSVGTKMWRHNAESWRTLWNEVGSETGTEWKVDVNMKHLPMSVSDEEGGTFFFRTLRERGERLMVYTMERVG